MASKRAGPPKAKDKRSTDETPTLIAPEQLEAIIARERAAGGHTDEPRLLCLKCRNWCDGIWYGKEGIPEMCGTCWREFAKANDIRPQRVRYATAKSFRPYVPTMADVLLMWANGHAPDAGLAYFERPGDAVWEARVLANIVRRRAAVEPRWLLYFATGPHAAALARLGPYVGRAGGYPLTRDVDFATWVRLINESVGDPYAIGA